MPLLSPIGRRRVEFELMEPRLMLSAAGDAPTMPSLGPQDVEMHLPGSISGSVFATTQSVGVRQTGDPGISGVRIELLSAAGELLAEAITDQAGDFQFPALAPGGYALRQVQPVGWVDGFEVIGSSGGHTPSANMISEIVLQPGAMVEGYAFAEIAAPVQAANAQGAASPLIGFLPPLLVSWSRPTEMLAPPSIEPRAPRPLQPLLPELRPEEPIFGGSSGVIEDRDAALEAFSDEDEAEGRVAGQALHKRAGSLHAQRGRDISRLAARDRALDSRETGAEVHELEVGEAIAEDVVERADRPAAVARRPIATGATARKPAA